MAMLLTPKILGWIRKAFTFGEFFPVHPFRWNKKSKLPEMETNPKRLGIWYLNAAFTMSYNIFVISRWLKIRGDKTATEFSKIYMLLMAVMHAIPTCAHLTVIMKRREIPPFVIGYINYMKYIEDTYMIKGKYPAKEIRMGERFLKSVFIGFSLTGILMTLKALAKPASPELLSSIFWTENKIPDDTDGFWTLWLHTVRIMSFLIKAIHSYNWVATTFLLVHSGFPFIFTSLVLIKGLREENKGQLLKSTAQNSVTSIKLYRELHIISHICLKMNEFPIAYCKTLIVIIVVHALFGAMKFEGFLATVHGCIGLNALAYLAVMFNVLGKYHEYSDSLLSEWRSSEVKNRNKLFRKQVKWLTTIKASVLSLYYVDKPMLLNMFQYIIETLVDLLMI